MATASTAYQTPLQINFVNAAALHTIIRKANDGLDLCRVTLPDIEKTLKKLEHKEPAPDLHSLVPECYHDLIDVFKAELSETLPPHGSYDHQIELRTENSLHNSAAAAPILLARKPGGGVRICVDYRGLNEITRKNRYPIPLIQETLQLLTRARYFTKLDIIAAFNKLRIAAGDEWKTAFRTRFRLFESLVMNFGLTNAPASWQNYINDILKEYLDDFVCAYMDDILIFSNSLEEHKKHVRQVLERLKANSLQCDINKCEFHTQKTTFLGLIISTEGISMDPSKVATILEWQTPRSVKDVQGFLGFANFYRRFIHGYSRIVKRLTDLTKKGLKYLNGINAVLWKWMLRITSPGGGGVLSQYDENGDLRPVAFFSKMHAPAECNYEIYDKELMAIVRAFEEWRPELQGNPHPIEVITDHKNLEYFTQKKLLNRRQARWAEFLSQFNYKLIYRSGKLGGKPDALTRRSQDWPHEPDDARTIHREQTVLQPQHLECLEKLFEIGYTEDPFPNEILEKIRHGERYCKDISLGDCEERDGQLYYRHRRYVPNYEPLFQRLLEMNHDHPLAGHPGREKTYNILSRKYYWPNMTKTVSRYVKNCRICRRTKYSRSPYQGILEPLNVPQRPWNDISVDFIVKLPESDGYDSIMVVVDRLTKMRHFIPCTEELGAEDAADLFLKHIWKVHGLPRTIVSDRGPQWRSRFWRRLCLQLKIRPIISTTDHAQTDGQTERMNEILEAYLRAFCTWQQDDWSAWLPFAEFAQNNHPSATTSLSPFFANYGYHPHVDLETIGTSPAHVDEENADGFVHSLAQIHEFLIDHMSYAQAIYGDNADRRRTPAPDWGPGDEVFLKAEHLHRRRPSRKLDSLYRGPFPIKARLSASVYELDLPAWYKIHPVFHVSKLLDYDGNPFPNQRDPEAAIEENDETEYDVKEILEIVRFDMINLNTWFGGMVTILRDQIGNHLSHLENAQEKMISSTSATLRSKFNP
uniref:Transposon Tf2-6 polyprotein n=1 Tax=Talaromyces marneffei PM1 TaxID=1077442 RepID=A0A093Y1I0_TALMA